MIEKIHFPEGTIPQVKPKRLPPDVFYEWVTTNIRNLDAAGDLERILRDPRRRPADSRFSLTPAPPARDTACA